MTCTCAYVYWQVRTEQIKAIVYLPYVSDTAALGVVLRPTKYLSLSGACQTPLRISSPTHDQFITPDTAGYTTPFPLSSISSNSSVMRSKVESTCSLSLDLPSRLHLPPSHIPSLPNFRSLQNKRVMPLHIGGFADFRFNGWLFRTYEPTVGGLGPQVRFSSSRLTGVWLDLAHES